MARDFSRTNAQHLSWGNGVLGALISGASAVSAGVFCQPDAVDGGEANDNRLFCIPIDGGTTFGLILNINGSTAGLRAGGRSQASDGFQSSTGGTMDTSRQHAGGVWDFAGDRIRTYRNGSQASSTAVTFGATTYQDDGTPTAGDRMSESDASDADDNFDGRMYEFALWSDDIGTAAFAQLAAGICPLLVRPDALVAYVPLIGDSLLDRVNGTILTNNGSVGVADHMPIFYPSVITYGIPQAASTIMPQMMRNNLGANTYNGTLQ